MRSQDIELLTREGWQPEMINLLHLMGYDLIEHHAAECSAEFTVVSPRGDTHGLELHRNDRPEILRQLIFAAGELRHQKQTRDAVQSLLTAAGMQLR